MEIILTEKGTYDLSTNRGRYGYIAEFLVSKASHGDLLSCLEKLFKEAEEVEELKELHRMQLVACSTAALGNTEESKELRIGKENPYWTPAYQDVCGAVDREIQYRSALEEIVVEAIRSGLKHIEDKARAGLRGNVFIVNEDNTTYAITDYLLDGAALEEK